MPYPPLFPLAAALLAAAMPLAAAAAGKAVYRCEEGGRVVYQQSACKPAQGERVELPPGNVADAPRLPPAAPAARATPQTVPAQATLPAAAAALPWQAEREACLTYLRPLLRDPPSGRILEAERDGRVLKVKLQASDARGRPQIRDAACEFVNGRVDDGWSRIQLKRLGWFAPRVVLPGPPKDLRRPHRPFEDSIEKDA
jgi:hypothetical protein